MKAVWWIRLNQLASRMKFWSAIVGYDPRDHSIRQSIYLVYLAFFFSIWGFAVFALLANPIADILSSFSGLPPVQSVITILTIVLLVDAILRGYEYGKRSPFIFSEEDAGLICQTPVDRRQVAIAWLLVDWLPACLPFAALSVVLSFASQPLVEPGGVVWVHLPIYMLAGLRASSVVIPLHLAFMAADYTLGAVRLREDRENPTLRWIPIGIAVLWVSTALVSNHGVQILLWPVIFPLKSGFGDAFWLGGFSVAVFLAVVSFLSLYLASPRLNLSRAAQESRFRWAYQQVSWLGDTRLTRQMKTRERLWTGHPASLIPVRAGVWALIWKDWETSRRTMNFSQIGVWLGIFGTSLGLMIAPDWGVRIWAIIFWSVLVGQHGTELFRADLEQWMISHPLPFTGMKMVIAKITLPILGTMISIWLAFGVAQWMGFKPDWALVWLTPLAALSIVLTALIDILHRCRSSDLLAGLVPEFGFGGLVLGILISWIPLALVLEITRMVKITEMNWLVAVFGWILGTGIAFSLWKLAANKYKNIE